MFPRHLKVSESRCKQCGINPISFHRPKSIEKKCYKNINIGKIYWKKFWEKINIGKSHWKENWEMIVDKSYWKKHLKRDKYWQKLLKKILRKDKYWQKLLQKTLKKD